MFKTISSKTALLITLAVSLLALTALAVWAQAARAQSSDVVSVSVSQSYNEDSEGSDITVTLRASGSNDFVPAINGEGDHGQYNVKTVDARADCSEDDFADAADFGVDGLRFEVKRSRDSSYTRSSVSQTFTTGNAVHDDILVRAGNNTDHDGMYICVEATYSDGDDDIVEYAVSSTMLDLEDPEIDDVVVNEDRRNQEYNVGDNIDIVVEFSERVHIRSTSEDTGDDLARPRITMPGSLGDAELLSLGSGTTLTFRYTVEFGDTVGDLEEITTTTIALDDLGGSDDDYLITDSAGNALPSAASDEEIDFRGGEIAIELDVRAKRKGDMLIIEATPDEYDNGTDDDASTIRSAVAYISEDAPDVDRDEDPCEDGLVASSGFDDTKDAADGDDGFGIDLDSDPDDMYYCFMVVDAEGRSTYTNVYRHATDSTAPRIHPVYDRSNNVLTITASDAESGIDESSLKWFWVDSGKRCRDGAIFNNDSTDGEITITIRADYEGDEICIRVENNQGRSTVQTHALEYVDPGTTDPGTIDPGTTDPGTTDPGTTDPGTTTGTGTIKVPKAWPGQAAWEQIILDGRAGAVNPWGCLDDSKIAATRGECISGGTSLTDGDYVYVNSYAEAGSSSTTVAPDPGPGTTDPGTTDPGTTDPGTTDPGTTDPGTTDPGTTDPGTTDPGTTDPDEVDPGTISLSYDFTDSSNTVEVSVSDKLTNVRYVVQEESGECNAAGIVDATTPIDVDGDAIEVEEEAVTNGSYVCVFATSSEDDEDGDSIVVYDSQQVGENVAATDEDDDKAGAGEDDDDDDGGISIYLIIGIVAVVIIGIVVALVVSGKRNQ